MATADRLITTVDTGEIKKVLDAELGRVLQNIRREAERFGFLDAEDQARALVPCMRSSAQDTVNALERAGKT